MGLSAAVSNVHHVAVFDDVLLAFEAQSAAGAGFGFGAGVEQLVPVNGLGADEMMLQVGVNGARGLLPRGYLSGTVQARHSSSPTVKNEIRPSSS